jgi:hypothetical protein
MQKFLSLSGGKSDTLNPPRANPFDGSRFPLVAAALLLEGAEYVPSLAADIRADWEAGGALLCLSTSVGGVDEGMELHIIRHPENVVCVAACGTLGGGQWKGLVPLRELHSHLHACLMNGGATAASGPFAAHELLTSTVGCGAEEAYPRNQRHGTLSTHAVLELLQEISTPSRM